MWLPLRAEGRRVSPTRHEALAWEAVVPPAAVAALRYPARPRSVGHSTGTQPLRRFFPAQAARPGLGRPSCRPRGALATDYSNPRPCREGATSPTGIEELR